MVNLANTITISRILAIPIFIWVLSLDISYKGFISAAVFCAIAATDALDGFVARRLNQKTAVGAFLDPLADKLLIAAALIFLIGKGVEAWMAYVILAREFAVTGLRLVVSKKKVIPASALGKLKTAFQIIGVIAVLTEVGIAWWVMLIATIVTIISGIDYFLATRHLLQEQ